MTDTNGSEYKNLVITGYVCAILFPIAGVVLGIITACKRGPVAKHGWAILALCTIAIAVYTAILVSAAQHAAQASSTYCTYNSMFGWTCS